MFYDWEFFHFHLGTTLDPNPRRSGFIQGTNELLFAILASDSEMMYLIDIHPHGSFTNQDLLRIIEENWGELLDPYTVPGIYEIDHNPSDNDIGSFRKARLVTMLQTPGGRILSPMGGGMMTDGSSVKNVIEADEIRANVREIQEIFIQQRETLTTLFKSKYNKDWDDLNFKLISFEQPEKIKELTTGTVWKIS